VDTVEEPSEGPVEAMGYKRRPLLVACLGINAPLLLGPGVIIAVIARGEPLALVAAVPIVGLYAAATGLWYLACRKRRLRLDRHGVTIAWGPRALGSWQTVPWGDVLAVEPTRWGLRIHTVIGWRDASLPRFQFLRGIDMGPVLPHDDAYRTVVAWWQAYGEPSRRPPPMPYPPSPTR
jgi:hypothetical protein